MTLEALSADTEEIARLRHSAHCLHDKAAVDAAIESMATQISGELAGTDPLLLCIMNGGLVLSGRLATLLDFPLQIDYLHATRYRGEVRGAELNWISYPRERLAGRPVLLIDDILDEGNTLKAVAEYCEAQGASRVYSAVLVEKIHGRRIDGIKADCVGLKIEDRFVFGCGLDYKGYLRNAPGIFAIDEAELSP